MHWLVIRVADMFVEPLFIHMEYRAFSYKAKCLYQVTLAALVAFFDLYPCLAYLAVKKTTLGFLANLCEFKMGKL